MRAKGKCKCGGRIALCHVDEPFLVPDEEPFESGVSVVLDEFNIADDQRLYVLACEKCHKCSAVWRDTKGQ